MVYIERYPSPVGELILACDEVGLIGVWIEGQLYEQGILKGKKETIIKGQTTEVLQTTKVWLDDYFAGKQPEIDRLTFHMIGSEFRQKVWKYLCEIPYGEITTYGEIAAKVAKEMGRERMSAQAVGGAVGHNPISIIIPCHRVIGKSGSLTGYAGGLPIKEKLLEHEGFYSKQ